MKIFLFTHPRLSVRGQSRAPDPEAILTRVATSTQTDDLVTALYLFEGRQNTRGTAYVREWLHPGTFTTGRGYWKITRDWPAPHSLPPLYKLIRMCLNWNPGAYPKKEKDGYGWQFSYASLAGHLALLFAHELHHFRRYHLGLHPGEGEHSANRWALNHVRDLGFQVEGNRSPKRKRRTRSRIPVSFSAGDPYRHFRSLNAGESLLIRHDPRNRYEGQKARVVRPLRRNARRLVIETPDRRQWRWPVEWLGLLPANSGDEA
jgi:hypothetical protein